MEMEMKWLLLYIFRNDMVYADLAKAFDILFLTIPEAAVQMDTSEAVVQSFIDSKQLKTVTLKGNTYIFKGDFEEFLGRKL